jgi:hypothetical protein
MYLNANRILNSILLKETPCSSDLYCVDTALIWLIIEPDRADMNFEDLNRELLELLDLALL